MVSLISQKMHKKLGLKVSNPVVDREVEKFIYLGATDFTEAGLKRLEKKILAEIGPIAHSTSHRTKNSKLSKAARAGMEIIAGSGES